MTQHTPPSSATAAEQPALTPSGEPRKGPLRIDWRRILLVLVFAGIAWIVWDHRQEAMEIGRTMQRADHRWLLLAAALQICYFAIYSEMYRWAFATVQIPGKPFSMLPTLLGSLVVGMVAPAWSAAGTALFVDDAIRRGHSPARATTATLLAHTIDFAGFSLILLSGLVTLYLRHELNPVILTFAAFFFIFTISMVAILALGQLAPNLVHSILQQIQRLIDGIAVRLKRKPPCGPEWADETGREFGEAARSVRTYPGRAVLSLIHVLAAHCVSATCLYCLFLAYNVRDSITVGPLIAGYSMATLAQIMSPIPGGVAIVEGTMKTVFTTLGVPDGPSSLITLTFRGLNFWLPLAVGFFVVGQIRSFQSHATPEEEPVQKAA